MLFFMIYYVLEPDDVITGNINFEPDDVYDFIMFQMLWKLIVLTICSIIFVLGCYRTYLLYS